MDIKNRINQYLNLIIVKLETLNVTCHSNIPDITLLLSIVYIIKIFYFYSWSKSVWQLWYLMETLPVLVESNGYVFDTIYA